MNAFDVLREKLEEAKSDWNVDYNTPIVKSIEIVNQVEQFCKETLNLNVDDKKPTATELVEHLHMHMDLFTFDPSTGNDLEPYQMNELNRDLYTTMNYAKKFLESIPEKIPLEQADYAHEASYIQGWNECLEKIISNK